MHVHRKCLSLRPRQSFQYDTSLPTNEQFAVRSMWIRINSCECTLHILYPVVEQRNLPRGEGGGGVGTPTIWTQSIAYGGRARSQQCMALAMLSAMTHACLTDLPAEHCNDKLRL